MNSNPLPSDDLETQPEKAFDLLAARINDEDFVSYVDTGSGQKQRHVLQDILAERNDGQLTKGEAVVLIKRLEEAMSAANQQLSVLDLMKIHENGLMTPEEATNLASRFLDPSDFRLHEAELKNMGVTKRDESLGTMVFKIPSIPKPHDQPVTRTRSGFAKRAWVAAGLAIAAGGTIALGALRPSTGNSSEGNNSADPAPISGPAVPGPATPTSPAPEPTEAAPEDKPVATAKTSPAPAEEAPAPTPEPTPAPTVVTENPATPQPAETETPPPGSREIPVTLDRSGNFNEKKSIAEWEDAGYTVTIKTGRDGSTFYALTKILEGKEAAFVVKPGDHVAKKTTILARRVR